MKKIVLLFLFIFLFIFSVKGQNFGDVIISEVYFDTPYEENIADSDTELTHIGEFIELFNSSTIDIDLSNWKIIDGSRLHITIPYGKKIKSGETFVIAYNPALAFRADSNNSDYFKILFPYESNNEPDYPNKLFYHNSILLYNKFESIRLFDSDGNERSKIKYKTVNHYSEANTSPGTNVDQEVNEFPFSSIRNKDNNIYFTGINPQGKRYFLLNNLSAIPSETKKSIQITNPQLFNSSSTFNNIVWEELEATPFGLPAGVNVPILPPSQNFTNTAGTNYLYTIEPTIETYSVGYNTPKIHNITYYDGLEREIQNIQINASTDVKDIIKHIEYDSYGRKSKDFLPFVSTSNGGALINSSTAIAESNIFYKNKFPSDFINTVNPYSENVFESNPNPMILESASSGEDWKFDISNVSSLSGLRVSSNHTKKFNYLLNQSSDNIIKYEVGYTNGDRLLPYLITGTYTENVLIKTIAYGENWYPSQPYLKDNTTEEFRNKSGNIILNRAYVENVSYDTYYVYDLFDNLVFVIPPKASQNPSLTSEILNGFCYQYKYDSKNRLVEKRLPDQDDWTSMIYDKQDRLVAIQDPKQKLFNHWKFKKYDVYGREIYSGIYTNSATRQTLQNNLNSLGENNDSIVSGGSIFGYSNNAFPVNVSLNDVYEINYFDQYPVGTPFPPSNQVENQQILVNINGLASLTKKRTVGETGEDSWSDTYFFYDKYARLIRNHLVNYLGGFTIKDHSLNFRGKTLYTRTSHQKNSSASMFSILDTYSYDSQERVLSHKQSINNQADIRINENILGKLGEVSTKKVGGQFDLAPLQELTIKYNVRGWPTAINDINNLGTNLFAYQLHYNRTNTTYISNAQYNGNVSQNWSKTAGDNNLRGYSYDYDALGRLQNAYSYKNGLMDTASEKNITYDKGGNIQSLYRSGGDDYMALDMDLLSYDYYNNSNRLKAVTDNINNPAGFKDVVGATDYEYDRNGNLIVDKNKAIALIEYNFMDLPSTINFQNGNWIKYKYDSAGNKLSKIVKNGNSTSSTDYLSGFHYIDGQFQYYPNEEGYLVNDNGNFNYVFNYTDHLGNVRVSYQDKNGDNTISPTEIIEQNSYYPFGLKQLGFSTQIYSPADKYKVKFSGKEYQDELGLNVYDFGARNYSAEIGRWFSKDPLASDFENWSPYAYAFNNPINFIDPDGLAPVNSKSNFWESFLNSLVDGVTGTIKYIANNPNHAGYGYSNHMKTPTVESFEPYQINWGNQLDPYWQIQNYTYNTVYGIYNFGGGIMSGDGRRTAQAIPLLMSSYATTSVVSRGIVAGGAGKNYNAIISQNNAKLAKTSKDILAKNVKVTAPDPIKIDPIKLTTSSIKNNPSVTYTIYDQLQDVHKFGVSDAGLNRLNAVMSKLPGTYTYKISPVVPKHQAHIYEKYLRSLHYNSTGQYNLPSMKVPYPVNFETGKRVKLLD
ncbi:DUF6443 domain-containing protein [Epilithonimonas zeae]|uniref:RHS repeat-associated core domain-containing protein n=1 Tax=Epilithonimonas zeae TaxID=1416779 RepID=A0A1N6GSP8_9FLAO|nr:DUF6443 domain-containing protein [Epilithonimonas zeae]SIO10584.1 RHS repeat-associated core domain-containing protein [Epilithonimonas zeae]